MITVPMQRWPQGRARGLYPPTEHASPPSEGGKQFFEDFYHLYYPENHILTPSSKESAPRWKIPGTSRVPMTDTLHVMLWVLLFCQKICCPQNVCSFLLFAAIILKNLPFIETVSSNQTLGTESTIPPLSFNNNNTNNICTSQQTDFFSNTIAVITEEPAS